jgi:hypothetical protein
MLGRWPVQNFVPGFNIKEALLKIFLLKFIAA